jgi:hypothetical protein
VVGTILQAERSRVRFPDEVIRLINRPDPGSGADSASQRCAYRYASFYAASLFYLSWPTVGSDDE